MANAGDKDTIMSRLGNLKNAEEIYCKVSVRDDYTIEERELIKEWVNKAEQKNKKDNTKAWKVRGTPKKRSSLGENHQADINNSTNYERENVSFAPLGNGQVNNNIRGNKFCIDYSKRGIAKCKTCKKQVAKGELRIGELVAFKVGHILQYFHIDCAFVTFRNARLVRNVITDINEIDGIKYNKNKTNVMAFYNKGVNAKHIKKLIEDANTI